MTCSSRCPRQARFGVTAEARLTRPIANAIAPTKAGKRLSTSPIQPAPGRRDCSLNASSTFGLRLELVADAVARLDERVPRRGAVDLLPQPPYEYVDRPVAPRLAPSPQFLEELVAGDDAAAVERELVEEAELGRREVAALAVDIRLHLARVDQQLLDLDRLPAFGLGRPHSSARGGVHASDELGHRERLHEVVVGADVERVHAVVLGPARADDDDRRADPLGAGALDHAPAVALRE